MSWLDELEYDHKYVCPKGHCTVIRSNNRLDDTVECQHEGCDQFCSYAGFVPIKLGGYRRVQKEKNGRVYYETTDSNGNVTRISKTKLDYLEKGTTTSQITNEYKNHVQDKQVEDFRKFRHTEALARESKATVTATTSKESIE